MTRGKPMKPGGQRIMWPLTPTARCVDCGQAIVHLAGGRVRIDPMPTTGGTLAITAGARDLRVASARPGDPRATFVDHADSCTRRAAPTPTPARPRRRRGNVVAITSIEYPCAHCGRLCANGTGRAAHERHCSHRPGVFPAETRLPEAS